MNICPGIDIDSETLIIVSDRGKAIIKAVGDKLTKTYHHYCPLHIERNLKQNGFTPLLGLFWAARNATTEAAYTHWMNRIRGAPKLGQRMYDYLVGIDNWQLYPIVQKGLMLHGFKSSNIVEGMMGWIKDLRKLSPYHFIKNLDMRLAADLNAQWESTMASQYALTPYAYDRYLEHERDLIRTAYRIQDCGGQVYQIRSAVANTATAPDERVSFADYTCSCHQWKQTGVPCIHATAIARHLSLPVEIFFAAPYFHPTMLQCRRKQVFSNININFILPTQAEVEDRLHTGAYQPMEYMVIENYKHRTSSARFTSTGESLGGGRLNPRNTEMVECPHCRISMVSVKNHSVAACLARMEARLELEAGSEEEAEGTRAAVEVIDGSDSSYDSSDDSSSDSGDESAHDLAASAERV